MHKVVKRIEGMKSLREEPKREICRKSYGIVDNGSGWNKRTDGKK